MGSSNTSTTCQNKQYPKLSEQDEIAAWREQGVRLGMFLPPGWSSGVDHKTGKPYFTEDAKFESQWEHPTGLPALFTSSCQDPTVLAKIKFEVFPLKQPSSSSARSSPNVPGVVPAKPRT